MNVRTERAALHLILCDLYSALVEAWNKEFRGYPEVEVVRGDLLEIAADAYVSPANSYGIMDGGIDLLLRNYFGFGIEDRVQHAITERGGKLPVGQAIVVPTDHADVPYLVVAPTMEVPAYVGNTNSAYLTMRALLTAVDQFNTENSGAIETLACPGLCTGVGGMPVDVAARQMGQAYVEFYALD